MKRGRDNSRGGRPEPQKGKKATTTFPQKEKGKCRKKKEKKKKSQQKKTTKKKPQTKTRGTTQGRGKKATSIVLHRKKGRHL